MPKPTLLTIVGNRPQFIKCAVVSVLVRAHFREVLLDTGQHYDHELAGIFFDQLDLPQPDISLGAGSGAHGEQTAQMLVGIEKAIVELQPAAVLVYGDTNSTLAGALAAAKLCVPVAHVEAGLRSYDRRMPEEINRVVADHLATILFCPTDTAVANLAREGIERGVHKVGDVMFDLAGRALTAELEARGDSASGGQCRRCAAPHGAARRARPARRTRRLPRSPAHAGEHRPLRS
jgi:UDP-GlcNAc3NAcA epimerase